MKKCIDCAHYMKSPASYCIRFDDEVELARRHECGVDEARGFEDRQDPQAFGSCHGGVEAKPTWESITDAFVGPLVNRTIEILFPPEGFGSAHGVSVQATP